MTNVIENNYIELQQKTTRVLVQQQVFLSEQEIIDKFLDTLNGIKASHVKLIADYKEVIAYTVEYLSESRSINDLTLVAESINNLVDTTKRLIKSFENVRFNGSFSTEVKQYKVLLDDIHEIFIDIQTRISNDKELSDLLNDF